MLQACVPRGWLSRSAMFGRKIHGTSRLAIGTAQAGTTAAAPLFSARMTGSYERAAWKQELHDRLMHAQVILVKPGTAAMEIALTTGPGRNWAAPATTPRSAA